MKVAIKDAISRFKQFEEACIELHIHPMSDYGRMLFLSTEIERMNSL